MAEETCDKTIQVVAKEKLDSSTDLVERLRYMCLLKGCSGIKGLSSAFRIMDVDGNRKLAFMEFQDGIQKFGVAMETAEVKKLFSIFDRDGNGKIDFNEFFVSLRPPMSAVRIDAVDAVFHKLDQTGDGVITIEDLRRTYNLKSILSSHSTNLTEDEIFQRFLDSFDTPNDRDGRITREEFLNYYSGVSASIDDDSYFVLKMKGVWNLD
ncbi:calcyphosin-like protein [Glandiceps talaboti]